jgi:hypothetical protein
VLEALGDLRVTLEQLLVTAAVVVARSRQRIFDAVLLFLEVEELLEGQHHLVVDRAAMVDDAVLREVPDRGACGHADGPLVRLLDAGEHAEQGGLAGAVGAAEADAIALLDVPRHVLEEDALAVMFGQVFYVNHCFTCLVRGGTRAPSGWALANPP